MDKQFEIIFEKLREMKEFDNTLICISSDHGEMLGDWDLFGKGKPWIASTNVPFMCIGPDVKRGKVVKKYVTNMDLTGTFLDYAETPKAMNMTSQSLRSFLNGTWNDDNNEYREFVSSGLSTWRMVVQPFNATVTWKFICCERDCPGRSFANATAHGYTKLLFNLVEDPNELNNVAALYPGETHHLQKLLPPNFCQS